MSPARPSSPASARRSSIPETPATSSHRSNDRSAHPEAGGSKSCGPPTRLSRRCRCRCRRRCRTSCCCGGGGGASCGGGGGGRGRRRRRCCCRSRHRPRRGSGLIVQDTQGLLGQSDRPSHGQPPWFVLGPLSLQIAAEPRFSYRPLITRSCSVLGLRMECARDADKSVIDAMGPSTGDGALVLEDVAVCKPQYAEHLTRECRTGPQGGPATERRLTAEPEREGHADLRGRACVRAPAGDPEGPLRRMPHALTCHDSAG